MFWSFAFSLFLILFPFLGLGSEIVKNSPSQGQKESAKISALNLRQALSLSLEKSSAYIAALKTYESLRLETRNSFAAFLPTLNLTSTHGPQGFDPSSNGTPAFSNTTQLTLKETLYNNGESLKQYEIAQWNEKQSELQLQKTKGQILLSVIQAYLNWSSSVIQFEIQEKSTEETLKQYHLVTNQYHQGVKTENDYRRFKTQSQRSELDLLQARNTIDKNRQILIAALGLSTDETQPEFSVIRKAPRFVLNSPTPKQSDLFEFKALEIKKKISELQVALMNRRRGPQVTLSGSAIYGSTNYSDFGNSWQANRGSSWNVSLQLSLPLMDWGVRDRNEAIQVLTEEAAQSLLRDQLISAEKDRNATMTDLQTLKREFQIIRELEANETLNFEKLKNEFRSGRSTYLDLTTGLGNLLDAQTRKLKAEFSRGGLEAQLKYAEGSLDENSIQAE